MSIRDTYISEKTKRPTKTSRWERLTPRERQVAALICQENGGKSYTNPQIANHLGISRETVKIHVRNILYKFNLHSKVELRRTLSGWDLWQYQ
jgi:two-component system nitrate/nitrite response regulator NarL